MRKENGVYVEPVSISAFDRNDRLFDTLLKMGLVVIPIFADKEKSRIDHFIVSSGTPISLHGQDQG
jgi:hypothetical protein